MKYFARVTAGLEQLAWRDIEGQTGATLAGFGHRRIDFHYDGSPAALLTLKSVDDVYVYVDEIGGLNHTRPSLSAFHQFRGIDFTPALDVITQIRPLHKKPTYGVTASFLGKRNYSRYDIEDKIHTVLYEKLPWQFVPNRPDDNDKRDIDLRILMEENWALVGIRLGEIPLHRRPYKTVSLPGSLKAPVAYCLCLAADLHPTDTLLDPTCGAGTILVEAAHFITRGGGLSGIDINPHAIEITRQNAESAGLTVHTATSPMELWQPATALSLYVGESQAIQFPPDSFTVVIANLPWGKQIVAETALSSLYTYILGAVTQGLSDGGRMLILTDQVEILEAALAQHHDLELTLTTQISLFGSHPTLHIIKKHARTTP